MPDVDLAIIGGGVAGLTAGLYAVRAQLDTAVLERMGAGGQIINADAIENYPGFPGGIKGYELAPRIAQQAMDAGLRVRSSPTFRPFAAPATVSSSTRTVSCGAPAP
ncbi:MAG: FAD-binding protein [Dehalococcoidia bacterium]